MNTMRGIAVLIFASAVLAGAAARTSNHKNGEPGAAVSRYKAVINVAGRAGAAAKPLQVEFKDWLLVRTPQGVTFPRGVFYIAQLKSGEIETEIAGKKERRLAGDFWTVPAGESMTVSFPPHRQAAQIQTITIAPATRKR